MSDHHDAHEIHTPDLNNPEIRHERADVNVWAVGKFGIALIFLCIISLGLLFGMFQWLSSTVGGRAPQSMGDARRMPPQPVLQRSPILDLESMRAAEEQILTSYGWVDREKGLVRIPIDKAIDLMAEKGLPARASAPVPSGVSIPTESGLGPKVQRPGGALGGEVNQQ